MDKPNKIRIINSWSNESENVQIGANYGFFKPERINVEHKTESSTKNDSKRQKK
jgi:hypothetical protein